ncbi:hypothetical protein PRNP1_009669 [Phytophthora ramorum]
MTTVPPTVKLPPTSSPAAVPMAKPVSRKRAAPTSKNKKPRKSRLIYDFKPAFLAQYFHMPQRQAAELIGVAVITVKRNCKRYDIKWPYRANKYKSGNKLVMSDKGRAFSQLPLDCMKQMHEEPSDNACDTDTESVEDDEQLKKDFCRILFSMREVPTNPQLLWGKTQL